MIEVLFLLAVSGEPKEEPIVITQQQKMEILLMIDLLAKQKSEAEANALHWYKQNKECRSKTQI